jgi:glutamyl-tRNA synthetase
MNIQLPKQLKQALDATKKAGKIIRVRFPPEPSGYLHLGHAKAVYYNYLISQKYKGELIVRMDDTNPLKESMEYEEAILTDIRQILKITDFKCSRTSDYFTEIEKFADQLVGQGLAYIDSTPSDQMKKERFDGIASQYRNQDLDTAQAQWMQLKTGTLTGACLRIRMDMSAPNKCLRDPAIYRPVQAQHYSQSSSDVRHVYPTYDFACPIVDILEKITHVFRNQEFFDRDEQYKTIVELLELECPYLDYYSRLEFTGVQMGKRHMKALIEAGQATGWDDPQLWTLRGLQRRGLHLDTIVQFLEMVAFNRNNGVQVEQELIWNLNRKVIDKISGRYVALSGDLTTHTIVESKEDDSIPVPSEKSVVLFHRNPQLGSKNVYYRPQILLAKVDSEQLKDDEEITLMNYVNMIYKDGNFIRHLSGDFKATEKKLTWLPVENSLPNVQLTTLTLDGQAPVNYVGEPDLKNVKKGDFIQLMKVGYFICDGSDGGKLKFYAVP